MACNCGPSRRSESEITGWEVTTSTGEKRGPFLTQTEARIALMDTGGGTITPVRKAA